MKGTHAPTTCALLLLASAVRLAAHSGPPFPIVSDRVVGPYLVSIWTDPDVTEDGSPGGQFWVTMHLADGRTPVPPATRVRVAIRPLDRPGTVRTADAAPVNGDPTQQFVALLMDHEGPFAVHAAIDGPRGTATVDSRVDATYDLRPARWLLVLYLLPFLAVAGLWLKLLRARHSRARAPRQES
jgi:hypothetical protein